MAEEIILSADLYNNAVTERTDDYTAKPRITGTARNRQVAERIVARGSEFRVETIEHILNMADQEKALLISMGKSVVDGVGQYLVNISGPFIGETAPFDPAKNKLGVTYTIGKLLRDMLNSVKVETRKATTGPVINNIIDSTTGEENTQLTSASAAIINGENIRIDGEGKNIGVFFTKTGGTPQKATLVIHNNPSQLTVLMPAMEDGEYTLSITTQYGHGGKQVKEPRTYTFPTLLYVGEKSGIGDRPGIL